MEAFWAAVHPAVQKITFLLFLLFLVYLDIMIDTYSGWKLGFA